MNLYLAALVAAALAFVLGAVWFDWLFPDGRRTWCRDGEVAGRAFVLTYLAACVVGWFGRWTFAIRPVDGAVLGLFLWVLAAVVAAAQRQVDKTPSDRLASAFWLIVLPFMGAVMTALARFPSFLGRYTP